MEDESPGPNEYDEKNPTHTGCEFSTTDFTEFKKHIAGPHNRPKGAPVATYCSFCRQTLPYSLHPGVCLAVPKKNKTRFFKPISRQTTLSDLEPK